MQLTIFHYQSYKTYLEAVLSERGRKKSLCDFIPIQTAFFSNVLKGKNNLSLEHGIRVCEFLNLNEKESHFLMLLLQFEKAGSKSLENYYLKQIKEMQREENKISSKIASHQTIAVEDQMQFYNSWLYVAIHILCSIPAHQSRTAIRNYLKMPTTTVDPIINFMVNKGMLREENGRLSIGQYRTHLAKDSPFLIKHHTNWRLRAVQSLDFEQTGEHSDDLHYSLVMSLAKSDIEKMKQIVFDAITRADSVLQSTRSEVMYSFCMDWFKA